MKVYDFEFIQDNLPSELLNEVIFISGSRELSTKRIGQIIKKYIFQRPIIWGNFKENYIAGFEGQPHFKSLPLAKLQNTLYKIEQLKLPNTISILQYEQKNITSILNIFKIKKARFINGSWHIVFHRRLEYEVIKSKDINYALISPFADEYEAKNFVDRFAPEVQKLVDIDYTKVYTDKELLDIAYSVSKQSYDYTWQTGAVLAYNGKVIVTGHNKILPYETFAMHHGSIREVNKAALNDSDHYDTIHAEMDILTQVINKSLSVANCTLYINLLPCPACAKALASTGIKEVVYQTGHYGDYAKELFEQMGIKARMYMR